MHPDHTMSRQFYSDLEADAVTVIVLRVTPPPDGHS